MPWGDRVKSSGSASPTATTSGGGWGSRVNGSTTHSGGGGLWDTLKSIPGDTLKDIEAAAVNTPGGIYKLGKDAYNAPWLKTPGGWSGLAQQWEHPLRSVKDDALATDIQGMIRNTAATAQHPLRHPGDTLLNAGGLFSLGAGSLARAGEISRVASEGGSIGKILRAANEGPAPEARVLKLGEGKTVDAGNYSRSAGTRAIQKGLDKLREKHPEVHFGLRDLNSRAGYERSLNERIRQTIADAPAHELIALAKGVSKPERLALRVVAEEVPISARIADATKFLGEAKKGSRVARLLRNHITMLEKAGSYLHDVATEDGRTVPRFTPEHAHLEDLYNRTKAVADKREADLTEANVITPETAASRADAPGQLILHGKRGAPEGAAVGDQLPLGFDPDHIPEVFHNHEGFYVSYRVSKKYGGTKRLGSKEQVGIPRLPGDLTHELTGAALRQGHVHPDTVRTVAESLLGSNRLLSLWRQRGELSKLADDSKLSEHHIPIRPYWMKNEPWPQEVRAAIDKLDKGLEPDAAAEGLKGFLAHVFPQGLGKKASGLSDEQVAKIPGIKWIDRRLLDKQNLPGPLVGAGQHPGVAGTLKTVDAINNGNRAAILYLKPAYAVPNMLGNLALNLVQQGFAAPRNLWNAARLNAKIGVEDAARVDAVMDEGIARSLVTDRGMGQKAVEGAAKIWQKGVDTPFRRASFLYEARKAGYATAHELHDLLHNKEKIDELVRVTRDAHASIIDYNRLGPVEKDIIRRVIFFYPWVKGSTIYAGHFVTSHPNQAALSGATGEFGKEQQAKDLGPVPSYAEGLFKTGMRGGLPLTSNPAAASILGTPAQVAETIKEAVGGHVRSAYGIESQMTPVMQGLISAVTGRNEIGQAVPPGQSPLKTFAKTVGTGFPFETAYQHGALDYAAKELGVHLPKWGVHGPKPNALYPVNEHDAFMQFLLGTIFNRPTNIGKLHAGAASEAHPTRR